MSSAFGLASDKVNVTDQSGIAGGDRLAFRTDRDITFRLRANST